MSFKAGIPLLSTLDDEDDESDGDFSVEIESGSTRRKWGRKHLLFCIALCLAVSLLLAVIVAITVPVVLLQVGQKGGATVSTIYFINLYKKFCVHASARCLFM